MKWLGTGYNLKAEAIGFADTLAVGIKKRERSQRCLQGFCSEQLKGESFHFLR